MERKFGTLKTIYEIVKDNIKPVAMSIKPNEIISRSHFPWDEIMQHLEELNHDQLITMKRSLVVVINITESGLSFISGFQSVQKD